MRDRCRAVLLAAEGLKTPEIQQRCFSSRRSVQRWLAAYRQGGLGGLTPGRPTGRKPKLPERHHEAFKDRVLRNANQNDGVCTLRGQDCRRILEQEFGAAMSLSGVYALLHRVGLSCLMPRPRHRKSDPEAQAAWLERAPLLSASSNASTPVNASRSGSRTRRGSASKAG